MSIVELYNALVRTKGANNTNTVGDNSSYTKQFQKNTFKHLINTVRAIKLHY